MNHIRHALHVARRYADGGSDGDSYDPALDPAEDESKAFADRAPVTVTPPPSTVDQARAAAAALSAHTRGTDQPVIPPPQPGQQNLTSYTPTVKERLLNTLSDSLAGNSLPKQNFVEGIGHIMDWTPGVGQALQAQEGIQHGDYQSAAAAFIPGIEGGLGGIGKKAATKALEHLDLAPEVFQQAYKIGEKQGSNPGGWFSGFQDGIDRYVKTPKNEQQAREEVLTGKLYELAGVPVAKTELTRTPNGKLAVASQKIPDATPLHQHIGLEVPGISGLQEHLPADAWLANWDTIGLDYDNVLVNSQGAFRIDHGGGLNYRAQGGLKGEKFGNTVGELNTLRSPSLNPQAAKVFGDITTEGTLPSAQRIAAITDQQIEDLVYRYIPDSGEAEKLANKLIARRDDIAKQYGISADELTGGGEHPPGTFPRELGPPLHPTGMESPQKMAQNLYVKHGGDPEAIAQEMYNIAKAGNPSYVDEVYKGLPIHIGTDVNAAITKIIEDSRFDPWGPEAKEAHVVPLPESLPKPANIPADEKLTAGPPLKLMQLNKTHSPAQLVQALSQTAYGNAVKNPKLVTPKQVAKIVSFVEAAPPGSLAANAAMLPKTQAQNVVSWISNINKGKMVEQGIKELQAGKAGYTAADLAEYEELKHQHELYDYEMAQGVPKKEQESTFAKQPGDIKVPKGKTLGGKFVPQHIFDAIEPMDWTKYQVKNGKYLKQFDFPNANVEDIKKQGYNFLQLWHGQQKGPEKGGYFQSWQEPYQFQGYSYPEEAAVFLSDDPYIAKVYNKGAVLPYIARGDGKVGVVHYPEAKHPDKPNKTYSSYSSHTNAQLTKAGREMGYDMLVLQHVGDMGGEQTQYMVLNPSILRAPTAKFDPAKKKTMESLSGIVGIPAAGAATYGITRQGEPQGQARGGRTRGYTMPLKPGSSKAVVSQNIREFHTGPTFAHTAAKFGKERANKQAIAVALSTARKYKGKAGGGPNLGKAEMYKPPKATENFDPEHFERLATRGAMYGLRHEGMINSSVPGRTDKLPMKVKSGSYILPADIPSALGQGNTMAGGEVLKKMFSSGPYGMPTMHGSTRVNQPRMNMVKPPSMPKMGGMGGMGGMGKNQFGFAEGGNPPVKVIPMGVSGLKGVAKSNWQRNVLSPGTMNNMSEDSSRSGMTGAGPKLQEDYAEGGTKGEQGPEESGDHVPIIAAGGEYIIDPVVVRHLGGGDIKAGHRVLDAFVLHTRKKHIETLKKLKPPKK